MWGREGTWKILQLQVTLVQVKVEADQVELVTVLVRKVIIRVAKVVLKEWKSESVSRWNFHWWYLRGDTNRHTHTHTYMHSSSGDNWVNSWRQVTLFLFPVAMHVNYQRALVNSAQAVRFFSFFFSSTSFIACLFFFSFFFSLFLPKIERLHEHWVRW